MDGVSFIGITIIHYLIPVVICSKHDINMQKLNEVVHLCLDDLLFPVVVKEEADILDTAIKVLKVANTSLIPNIHYTYFAQCQ